MGLKMIKSILLPIDGSAFTQCSLQYGVSLARSFGAKLKVLTVIDIRIFEWAMAMGVEGFAPVIPSSAYQEESQQLLEQKAEKILERAAEFLKSEKVNFETEKTSGSPSESICEKSRLADMIIMGSHGEFARWSDKMLGATLESVSRLCIKPILVTHKEYHQIKKILFAYDGSQNSNKALPWVGALASELKAPVTILTVNSDDQEAETILNEAVEYLRAYNLKKINRVKKTGDAVTQIISLSNELSDSLLIMGSYGHSRIREAILGSTTVQVMRRAKEPILLVK